MGGARRGLAGQCTSGARPPIYSDQMINLTDSLRANCQTDSLQKQILHLQSPTSMAGLGGVALQRAVARATRCGSWRASRFRVGWAHGFRARHGSEWSNAEGRLAGRPSGSMRSQTSLGRQCLHIKAILACRSITHPAPITTSSDRRSESGPRAIRRCSVMAMRVASRRLRSPPDGRNVSFESRNYRLAEGPLMTPPRN